MRATASRAERRATIARALIADAARSDRSIARALAVSHTTVSAVRGELEASGQIDRRPDRPEAARQQSAANLVRTLPGTPGAALKHGVDSQQRLAPLRARLEDTLRVEFPTVDARRLFLAADLLARIEAARAWIDERGGVVRNRHGDVYPVADRLEAWGKRADALLKDLRAEEQQRHEVDPVRALEQVALELSESEEAA